MTEKEHTPAALSARSRPSRAKYDQTPKGYLITIVHRIALLLLIIGLVWAILTFLPGSPLATLPFIPSAILIAIALTILVMNYLFVKGLGKEVGEQAVIQGMASADNEMALMALAELRASGRLSDGSLRGIKLSRANLAGAHLRGADLANAWSIPGPWKFCPNWPGLLRADWSSINISR